MPLEHDAALVSVLPVQLEALHETPGYVHVSPPVHAPPQGEELPVQAARAGKNALCGWPLESVVHVPTEVATSHAWHSLVLQALLQQTPSTQCAVLQSTSTAQAEPIGRSATQLAVLQWKPALQPLGVQLPGLHDPEAEEHVAPPHVSAEGLVQDPAPLQTDAAVSDPEPTLLHVAAVQTVLAPGNVQLELAPVQDDAHGADPGHVPRAPCGAPVTVRQVPSMGATSHASQLLLQALLQTMPSTQVPPEINGELEVQGSPKSQRVLTVIAMRA